MRETWAQSLGQEDPLEKKMATHSGTLAWKIPWTEDLVRLQSMGSQRVGHDWATSLTFSGPHKLERLTGLHVVWFLVEVIISQGDLKINWNLIYLKHLLKELLHSYHLMGFPGDSSGKEPACQCRRFKRRRLDPWVGKIPWRRSWQPTSVFLPEESNGQRSLAGYGP